MVANHVHRHVDERLDRIQMLVQMLVRRRGDLVDAQDLSERIYREILSAKQALGVAPSGVAEATAGSRDATSAT